MAKLFSSFVNSVSGLGTSNDQDAHTSFCARERMGVRTLEGLMRVEPILRNIVEAAPADTLRAWRVFSSESEGDKVWNNLETILDYKEAIETALVYSEVYGGAVIVPSFDLAAFSAEAYRRPFNVEDVAKGGYNLRGWLVYAASELHDEDKNKFTNIFKPSDPRKGFPERWEIKTNGNTLPNRKTLIHSSWCIPIMGPRAMRHDRPTIGGGYFGESRIDIMFDYIKRASTSQMAAASALLKANIDVFYSDFGAELEGCATAEEAMNVIQQAQARVAFSMKTTSSNHPITLAKGDEELQRLGNNAVSTGMKDTMGSLVELMVAARPIPITRALGQQSKGLSNSNDQDLKHWYDLVDAFRRKRLPKAIRQMDIIAARDNNIALPTWEFGELKPLTQKEGAELAAMRATTDAAYNAMELPDIMAKIVKKLAEEGTYSFSAEEVENAAIQASEIE